MIEKWSNAMDDVFKSDQEEAAHEEATRDQTMWEAQVRDTDVTARMKEAHAKRTEATASLLDALATLLWFSVAAAFIVGLTFAVLTVVGWFA